MFFWLPVDIWYLCCSSDTASVIPIAVFTLSSPGPYVEGAPDADRISRVGF